MSGRSSTKEQLAEAGRRKLEAFRKQKAQGKKAKAAPAAAAPPAPPAEQPEPPRAAADDVQPPAQNGLPAAAPQQPAPEPQGGYSARPPPPVPVFKKPPSLPAGRSSSGGSGFPLPPTAPLPTPSQAAAEVAGPRVSGPPRPPPVVVPARPAAGSPEAELPVSSPLPSGYAALSDSYLYAGRPAAGGAPEAEEDAGPPPQQAAPERAAAGSPPPRPSALQGFASFFGRRQDPPRDAGGESAPEAAGPAAARPPEAANGSNGHALELAGGGRGRHGRFPSLNAWNEPAGAAGDESSLPRPPEASPAWPEASAARLKELSRPANGAPADAAGASGRAAFHFSRLPEPAQDPALPVWRSRSPSPRRAESPADDSGAGERPPSSPPGGAAAARSRPAQPSWAGGPDAGTSGAGRLGLGVRKEASLADLIAGGAAPPAGDDGGFGALQQHIDELTDEKFELARGLERQQQVAAQLAGENQRLLDDYNQQAAQLQRLRQQLEGRDAEVGAQQLAVAGLGAERDACRSAVLDADQRASALAAEVVALEEKYLKARSAELAAGKRLAEAREAAEAAQRQQASAAAECAELRGMVAALQEEKRKWPEQLQKLSAGAGGQEAAAPQPPAEPAARAPARGIVANGAEVSRVIGAALQQTAELQPPPDQRGGAAEGRLPEPLELLLPPRRYLGGAAGEAAAVVAEERRLLASIHALLAQLAQEKQALLFSRAAQQEQCRGLQARNRELAQQLDALGPAARAVSPPRGRVPGRPVAGVRK